MTGIAAITPPTTKSRAARDMPLAGRIITNSPLILGSFSSFPQ